MRARILGDDCVQVGKGGVIVLILLVSQSALGQGDRYLRVVWKGLNVIGECFDNFGNVFRLHVTQAKLVSRFGAQFGRKLRGA